MDSPRPPLGADELELRQIVDGNADGIIVVDGEARVRFANPVACQILGRDDRELIGHVFGFPVLRGERAEIDLLRPTGGIQVAEMRVVDTEWEGSSAQLISLRDITEYRRAQQALRDAEAFNWAILNSLSVHVAVLDASGTIIAVNDAWCDFARQNGDPDLLYTGIGVNYFDVCRGAAGPWSDEALPAVAGMRDVLAGRSQIFEIEYPCHSPDEERWFVLRAVPLRGERPGLVVSHTNVTKQRQMAQIAAEAAALRDQLTARDREMRGVNRISQREAPAQRSLPTNLLRQRQPAAYHEAVRIYANVLDEAVRRRAQPDGQTDSGLRELGERMARWLANPRDVVEVHLAAVRAASIDATPIKQQAYLEEGRLLVLELMGHLATAYRQHAPLDVAPRADDHD
ncbi:MAG: PAS domain-containing protein [Oscillochloridaceae bacterium umkhey_bin13]